MTLPAWFWVDVQCNRCLGGGGGGGGGGRGGGFATQPCHGVQQSNKVWKPGCVFT